MILKFKPIQWKRDKAFFSICSSTTEIIPGVSISFIITIDNKDDATKLNDDKTTVLGVKAYGVINAVWYPNTMTLKEAKELCESMYKDTLTKLYMALNDLVL